MLRKKLIDIVILLSWAFPATVNAAPKWLTAAPRSVARTMHTVLMPWRDPTQAFRDYLIVAAVFGDAKTTRDNLIRSPYMHETSPLMSRRPAVWEYWLEMGPLAIGEASLVTASAEDSRDRPWRHARLGRVLEPDLTLTPFIAVHIRNTIQNVKQ